MEDECIRNLPTPCQAIAIDEDLCSGCNACADVCRSDVMIHSLEEGAPPLVVYPDECWFCGCCVDACPTPGAIRMAHPLNQRVGWKRKDTQEFFRIGMKNPPAPYGRPPVGGW